MAVVGWLGSQCVSFCVAMLPMGHPGDVGSGEASFWTPAATRAQQRALQRMPDEVSIISTSPAFCVGGEGGDALGGFFDLS